MTPQSCLKGTWFPFLVGAFALGLNIQPAVAQDDGGFGKFTKKNAQLSIIHPPKILILQNTYSVEISGPQATDGFKAQLLNSLKSLMPEAKKDIQYAEKGGEVRLFITVDAVSHSSEQTSRSVTKYDKETAYEVTQKFQIVNFSGRGTYRIEDWTNGVSIQIDKDSLNWDTRPEYNTSEGQSPPPAEAFKQQFADSMVTKLRNRLVGHKEDFLVLLGKVDKTLDEGIALATAGSWEDAHRTWSAVPAFKAPKAEAYRMFNLGVAAEALGYQFFRNEEDIDKVVEKFKQAKELYLKAIQLKPDEKHFKEAYDGTLFDRKKKSPAPLERVEKAFQVFADWKKQREAFRIAQEEAAKNIPPSGPPQPTEEVMRNEEIVELVKAGASEGFIEDTLKTAKKIEFDLSVQARISLMKAGVSEKVITLMSRFNNQSRVSPAPAPPSEPKPDPPKPPRPPRRGKRG